MSKNETTKDAAKKSQKKAAEKAAPEEKVTPEAKAEEAPQTAPAAEEKTTEAPAEASAEETAAAEGEAAENKAFDLGGLFSTLFNGVKDSEFFTELKDANLAFAPEGFFVAEGDEDFAFDGPCVAACAAAEYAGECAADDDYTAGIAEGLRRAQHPVFGIGVAVPEPVAPAPAPIVIRDEETRSMAHLVELKKLHDVGILTEAEYTAKKTDILRRIY